MTEIMYIIYLILWSIALYFIGLLIFEVYVNKKREFAFLKIIYTLAYWYKAIILIILSITIYNKENTTVLIQSDTRKFREVGQRISSGVLSFEEVGIVDFGIYYTYSVFDSIFRNQLIFLSLFLSFISLLLLLPVSKLAYDLYGRNSSVYTTWLISLYPGFIALSIFPHKDVIASIAIAASIYSLYRLHKKVTFKYLCFAGLSIFIIYAYRPELLAILIVTFFSFLIVSSLYSKSTSYLFRTVGFTLLALTTAYFVGARFFELRFFEFLSPYSFQDAVEQGILLRRQGLGGVTGFGEWIVHSGPATRFILGSAAFLIKPFPPSETLYPFLTLSSFLTPGAIVLLFLYPFSIAGIIHSVRKGIIYSFLPLIFCFSVIVVSSLVYGAGQIRYRLQVVPFILMFSSFGFVHAQKYTYIFFWYFVLFLSTVAVYILI